MSDEKLAAEISAEIDRLADQLAELDLIEEDTRGTPRLPEENVLRANPWACAIGSRNRSRGSTAASLRTRSSRPGCGPMVSASTRCSTRSGCRSSGARRQS